MNDVVQIKYEDFVAQRKGKINGEIHKCFPTSRIKSCTACSKRHWGGHQPNCKWGEHVKELSSNSQTISKSQKELAPTQTESQTSTTNLETPNQVVTTEIGMKRKLDEEQQQQPAKKSKEDDEEPNYLYEFKDKILV